MRANQRDLFSGAIFCVIGVFFATYSLVKLNIGTAGRMGPGYFPLYLGGVLALMGVALLVRAFLTTAPPIGALPWRAILAIGSAPIAFAVFVRPFGIGIAVFALVELAALASRRITFLYATLLAICLTVICVGIFKFGLGQPLPLFGTVLSPIIGYED